MIFKEYKISEIGQVVSGGTPKTAIEEYWNGDISWITPKDLSSHDDVYISRGERNISLEGLNNSSAKLMPKNTVLLTSRAPIGYIAIAENELATNQGFKSLICNEDICHFKYFYYWLKLNINYIVNNANGSTFKEISGKTFKELTISLPSLDVQKKISNILWSIDEKIGINKKINHNLYHILMDLFIKNYLNFNENEFSNSIETIPKLWNIGHFNDIIKEVIAGDWGKSEIEGNYTKKTFCIRGADIPDLKENFVSTIPIRYILQKNFNKKHLIENSVVIEISGGSPSQSTGRTLFITNNLLNQYNHDLICTNFCKSILAEEEYSYFVYFYLNYLYDRNVMFAYENGTTGIKNFDFKSFFNNFPIIIPVKEELVTFNKICELFFDKIYKNIDEMNKLSHIKNILLPKLMSGEIDVSNIKI